ncbi:HAMP domain-containing protein [Megasphaera vaginalis (ex Srinivasan et al. 2021)]|uniref:HAMP domain-containing protein n=1 Tax=Megasphaera vaginalis (ex Srinivasan et al. 2021) TaxID=1111454 RepID=UPI0018CB1B98|nr:HAMP domain-containing protein [Megasphaera vaginalis (ex Srinivasan et al. 2021)]
MLILLLTIIFLSHFIMRHILPPLQKLQDGAEEIKNGNLQVQLPHTAHDEFEKPLAMFNVMTAALHLLWKRRPRRSRPGRNCSPASLTISARR